MAVQFAKYGPNAERMWVTGSFCKYIISVLFKSSIVHILLEPWMNCMVLSSLFLLLNGPSSSSGIIRLYPLTYCLWTLLSFWSHALFNLSHQGRIIEKVPGIKGSSRSRSPRRRSPFPTVPTMLFFKLAVCLYRYLPCYWFSPVDWLFKLFWSLPFTWLFWLLQLTCQPYTTITKCKVKVFLTQVDELCQYLPVTSLCFCF